MPLDTSLKPDQTHKDKLNEYRAMQAEAIKTLKGLIEKIDGVKVTQNKNNFEIDVSDYIKNTTGATIDSVRSEVDARIAAFLNEDDNKELKITHKGTSTSTSADGNNKRSTKRSTKKGAQKSVKNKGYR